MEKREEGKEEKKKERGLGGELVLEMHSYIRLGEKSPIFILLNFFFLTRKPRCLLILFFLC